MRFLGSTIQLTVYKRGEEESAGRLGRMETSVKGDLLQKQQE